MPKEQTYWCVFTEEGIPDYATLSWQRKDCIKKFLHGTTRLWEYYRKEYGYTVQKVTINIVTK